MVLRQLCYTALLVVFFAVGSSSIDCSRPDSCFGEPLQCEANTTCRTLFEFEEDGSLNLYLRNFTDPIGYAAFAVGYHPDETVEYFFCLPHQENLYRGFAEIGGAVLVIEENLTGFVDNFDNDTFQCMFNVTELPESFQREQVFFVSIGTYDEAIVIYDGIELHNLESFDDDDDDYIDEEPIAHFLGSPFEPRSAAFGTQGPADDTVDLINAVNAGNDATRLSRARRHWIGDEEQMAEDEEEYEDFEGMNQNINPEDDYELNNRINRYSGTIEKTM